MGVGIIGSGGVAQTLGADNMRGKILVDLATKSSGLPDRVLPSPWPGLASSCDKGPRRLQSLRAHSHAGTPA